MRVLGEPVCIYLFRQIQFLRPCVWYQLFMATGSGFGISSSSTDTQAAQACCIATEHIWNNSAVRLEISNSWKKCVIRKQVYEFN